jgi:hypothetical protein
MFATVQLVIRTVCTSDTTPRARGKYPVADADLALNPIVTSQYS